MWSISDVKSKGKAAFKKNYWRCVLASLILSILAAGSSAAGQTGNANNIQNLDTSGMSGEELSMLAGFLVAFASFLLIFSIIWIILRIFVLNPLEVGCRVFFKENLDNDATLDELKAGFGDYKRSAITILLRDIFLALWFCLLIIPGIIKSYSYKMVPYILLDEPQLSAKEVITRSREMMNGHKWRAFLLDLSFIGWELLSLITCGLVGLFYVSPYENSTQAALYKELKGSNGQTAETVETVQE